MYKNKEWLEQQYQTKTTREIAAICNTSKTTINRWLKKFEINIRHGSNAKLNTPINPNVDYNKPYRNKEWLMEQYKTKSVEQIAKENGVSKQSLLKWFKKFNIERRQKRDAKLINKIPYNDNYFENIDDEHKAYWLGFLMADGCYTSKNTLSLGLSKKDIEHLKKFAQDIDFENKICEFNSNGYQKCSITISCKKFCDDLERLGIVRNKTGKESVPSAYIPKHLIRHFIRGYFDGDGCITYSIRKNHLACKFNIVSASLEFLECVLENFLENNIDAHIYNYSARYNINFYSLEITKLSYLHDLYEYLYKDSTIFLERKRNKFDKVNNYFYTRII